jgi:hypothetical protein
MVAQILASWSAVAPPAAASAISCPGQRPGSRLGVSSSPAQGILGDRPVRKAGLHSGQLIPHRGWSWPGPAASPAWPAR